jgi:hypothetical protein
MKTVTQSFAVVAAVLLVNSWAFAQPSYTQFGNLNNSSVDVTSIWTKLKTTPGAHSFNKIRKDSTIEVVVNSRFSVGEFTDATGVSFQVRIDDKKTPNFGNQGSLTKANTSEFLSILAVFQKLPPGKHTVSIWGRAAHMGKASGMLVDPGGWGGKIIVKEAD